MEMTYDEYKALAKPFPGKIETIARGPYAYNAFRKKKTFLAAAEVFRTEDPLNEVNLVVLGVVENDDGTKHRTIWCGDNLLQNNATAERRTQYETLRDSMPKKLSRKMDELIKACEGIQVAQCDFWRGRVKKQLCAHTAGVMALPDIDQHFAQLEEDLAAYKTQSGGARARVSGPEAEIQELLFRVPVLVKGDRGSGKTTFARKFAIDNNYHFVEVGGNESMEAVDLLGMDKRHGTEVVWYDGALAEAFRLASLGKKVVLLIDEALRIPQRQLSVLLSALSPFRGMYRLSTGRILAIDNGMVSEKEEIFAPVHNLAIVATTNVGMEYAVDDLDPAIEERFEVVYMDTTKDSLKRAVSETLELKGFPASYLDKLEKLYGALNLMVENGSLNRGPTIRTMVRCLELSNEEDDIQRHLLRAARHWVDHTSKGKPVPEQVALAEKAIKSLI